MNPTDTNEVFNRIAAIEDPEEQYHFILNDAALRIADLMIDEGTQVLYDPHVTAFVNEILEFCAVRYNRPSVDVDKDLAKAIDDVDIKSLKQAKELKAQGRLH